MSLVFKTCGLRQAVAARRCLITSPYVGYRSYSTPVREEKEEEEAVKVAEDKEDLSKLNKATAPKKLTDSRPSINKVGVPFDPYIPATWKHMPNPVTSPIQFGKAIFRRVYMACYDWVQVYQFKRSMGSGYKPNFLKWKNESIETYVEVNKAFSGRKVNKVRSRMAEYVYFALARREKQLPKNTILGWDLVKFNKAPKLMTFHSFPHDDGSVLLAQIVYRFDTKQRMTIKESGKPIKEKTRDLVEYLAFNVDPYTDDVVIAGSLFESPPDKKFNTDNMPSQRETINHMIENGDIYRPEPSTEEKLKQVK